MVCLSVCLSTKMAEPIKMPFGMWTRVGPRNYVLDGVQIPMGRSSFEGGRVMSEFFCMPPSTIPSGPGVEISPYAVDQRSSWQATGVVACHIKFSL